jgi:two-component system OmpR family response regulator
VGVKRTILVVEDEKDIRDLVRFHLEQEGYATREAESGETALAQVAAERPALVVLDLMLPGTDGLEVCRRLRAAEATAAVPIVMLTARAAEVDRVLGLEMGADDYVTKPFAMAELLARVEAIGRRPKALTPPVLQVADLRIDTGSREVTRAGQPIDLTPKEYAVLAYLAAHAGRVMSRTLITEYVWDYHFDPGTNIVDVVINRLRKKIDQGKKLKLIHTVRGVGYVVKA